MTGVRTEHAVPHIVADRKHMSEDDIARLVVDRTQCGFCGTRKDYHEQFGCKRYVEKVAA